MALVWLVRKCKLREVFCKMSILNIWRDIHAHLAKHWHTSDICTNPTLTEICFPMSPHMEVAHFLYQVHYYLHCCLDDGRRGQQRACVHRLCNTAYITSRRTIWCNDRNRFKPPAPLGCYINPIHSGGFPVLYVSFAWAAWYKPFLKRYMSIIYNIIGYLKPIHLTDVIFNW